MNTFQVHVHARYNGFASFCCVYSVGILYARVRALSAPLNTREEIVYMAAWAGNLTCLIFGHFNTGI